MKALVLGGTGFLGRFVVDELLARGHEVTLLARRAAEFGGPVEVIRGDPADPAAIVESVAQTRPDVLLDMLHSGAHQAAAVLCAATGAVGRTVHLSCASVYGTRPICPVDEETEAITAEAADPHTAAKIAADRVVLEAVDNGQPAIVLRLPHLYGPRDPRCAEWYFARRVLEGRSRIAVPDGGLHICHRGFVQNMAGGVVRALTSRRAKPGVYNLGEEKLYTLAQLARGVARALDREWDIYSVPGHLWTTPYAYTSFFDLRKARAHLGYRDRMIPRDGLELTLAWLSQHPRGDQWRWPGIEDPFDYAAEDRLIDECGAKLSA